MRRGGGFRAAPALLLALLACWDAGPTEPALQIPNSTNPSTDRAALTALYEATNGAGWKNSRRWLDDGPLTRWYGVDTDADGRVTELRLRDNGLEGRIPPHIGHLSNLTNLDLGENALTGPIPPEIGGLAELRSLALWSNRLEGRIPPQIGRLSSLTELHLSANALTGPIPPEIGRLSALRGLGLWSNDLTGSIPPELGDLEALSRLWLSGNDLTGPIPREIGDLLRLTELNLGRNDLTGPIPPEIGRLRELRELHLGGNDLTGPIPPEIGGLSQLQSLELWRNDLGGPIPAELGDLAALIEVWLDHNDLTGPIPPEIGRLSALREVHLTHNALTGPIPPEIGGLSALRELYLAHNALTGPIPPEIGGLSQLRILELWSNEFGGSIPAELGDLTRLTRLGLERNALSGPIPASLGNVRDLERLALSHNDLSGPVPAELSGLAALRVLAVNGNPQLSGLLPVGLKDLPQLTALNAGGTALCAPADPGFQAWLRTLRAPRVPRCNGDVAPVYLTQAVQSFAFPVPLVSGRPALLRVFLTAPDGAAVGFPPVRARFYLGAGEIYTVDVAGPAGTVPSRVEEGRLDASVNVAIPAEVIRPGVELVVEVDPEDTLGPDPGTVKRIPAAGRQAIDARAVPALHLAYLPIVRPAAPSDDFLSRVADLTEDDPLFRPTLQWLPIAHFTVDVREPIYTMALTSTELMAEIEAIRVVEGETGYYMGGLPPDLIDDLGLRGRGFIGGRTSISELDSTTVAHELGHNMSLRHAPCGGAGGPDPGFPTRDGTIGAWGFNSSDSSLVDPEISDLMSYCGPKWISDFSFSKAVDHRLREEGEAAAAQASVERTLLLWGAADSDGTPFLEPAFVIDAPPTLPRAGGPYTLTGATAGGETLFSLNFDMQEMADGDEESGFAFTLPVSLAWADRLATVALAGPRGTATLDGGNGPPAAILRDPRTGRIRAIVRDLTSLDGGQGGLVTLAGAAVDPASVAAILPDVDDLDVLISRGLPAADQWRR